MAVKEEQCWWLLLGISQHALDSGKSHIVQLVVILSSRLDRLSSPATLDPAISLGLPAQEQLLGLLFQDLSLA